jgi:hypothetical protein
MSLPAQASPVEAGQRLVLAGQVTGEYWNAGRGVGVAAGDDALEEDSQDAQPLADGVGRQRLAGPASASGQPRLISLDVAAFNLCDPCDIRVMAGPESGEDPQGDIGRMHACWTQRDRQLIQIAGHGDRQLWSTDGELIPSDLLPRFLARLGRCWRRLAGHDWFPSAPASRWASMTSAARRYSPASQSSAKCR